jgi:hypothetical protein
MTRHAKDDATDIDSNETIRGRPYVYVPTDGSKPELLSCAEAVKRASACFIEGKIHRARDWRSQQLQLPLKD